jgi:sulfatase maturation enzyme AslB (radical SAM superfamily)
MSDYNKAADQAEKQLNFISPSMCYAKWSHVSLHLTNGMTSSCYHPPLHKVNLTEIKIDASALHNTKQKKQERSMMLKGDRPEGCQYCWKIEDVGGRSDRIYRSGEEWAQNSRKDIFTAMDHGNINPRYVEVNFNQACNFKCMYCSPHLSTEWEREIKNYGPYNILKEDGTNARHNDIEYLAKDGLMPLKIKQELNPYLEAFWKWWPDLYRKLEVFRITGGEPLMDVNTYRVLDYIYEHPNAWLEFSITSNLCPPKQELMEKFVEKLQKLEKIQIWNDPGRFNPGSGNHWYVNMALKHFALFVSLDSVGDQAEYIRAGLNYKTLQRNVRTYLDNTINTTITFINTYNALSVPRTKEFLEYVLELRKEYSKEKQGIKYIPIHDPNYTHPDYVIHPRQRVWFDIPLLRKPAWQSIFVLPEEFDKYIEEAIEFMKQHTNTDDFVGFYDFEINKLERNLNILRESRYSREEADFHRQNFISFYDQYDKRKGTNLLKIFTEFKSMVESWR